MLCASVHGDYSLHYILSLQLLQGLTECCNVSLEFFRMYTDAIITVYWVKAYKLAISHIFQK